MFQLFPAFLACPKSDITWNLRATGWNTTRQWHAVTIFQHNIRVCLIAHCMWQNCWLVTYFKMTALNILYVPAKGCRYFFSTRRCMFSIYSHSSQYGEQTMVRTHLKTIKDLPCDRVFPGSLDLQDLLAGPKQNSFQLMLANMQHSIQEKAMNKWQSKREPYLTRAPGTPSVPLNPTGPGMP